jgi:hypothetical protein
MTSASLYVSLTSASLVASFARATTDLARIRPSAALTTQSAGTHTLGPVHYGHMITIKLAPDTHLRWRLGCYPVA